MHINSVVGMARMRLRNTFKNLLTLEDVQAVMSGGARLKDLKWEIYKDGIMQVKVPAGFATDQLFVNGERQPLARYPNFDPKERHFIGWAKDAFSPQRAARWKDPAGGFIHALHAAEWGGMHYVITGKSPDNSMRTTGVQLSLAAAGIAAALLCLMPDRAQSADGKSVATAPKLKPVKLRLNRTGSP